MLRTRYVSHSGILPTAPVTCGIIIGSRVGGGGSATIPIKSTSLACTEDLGLVNPALLTFLSFIYFLTFFSIFTV